jgi:hypothetical protein
MAPPVYVVTFRPPREMTANAVVIPTISYRVTHRQEASDAMSDAAVAAAHHYPGWTYLHCREEVQIAACSTHSAQKVAA